MYNVIHEKGKQFHKQVTKKYEKETLQQKKELILNEEKIAVLTQQHEEATGLLKHKAEEYEELQSGYVVLLTNYC